MTAAASSISASRPAASSARALRVPGAPGMVGAPAVLVQRHPLGLPGDGPMDRRATLLDLLDIAPWTASTIGARRGPLFCIGTTVAFLAFGLAAFTARHPRGAHG